MVMLPEISLMYSNTTLNILYHFSLFIWSLHLTTKTFLKSIFYITQKLKLACIIMIRGRRTLHSARYFFLLFYVQANHDRFYNVSHISNLKIPIPAYLSLVIRHAGVLPCFFCCLSTVCDECSTFQAERQREIER